MPVDELHTETSTSCAGFECRQSFCRHGTPDFWMREHSTIVPVPAFATAAGAAATAGQALCPPQKHIHRALTTVCPGRVAESEHRGVPA